MNYFLVDFSSKFNEMSRLSLYKKDLLGHKHLDTHTQKYISFNYLKRNTI